MLIRIVPVGRPPQVIMETIAGELPQHCGVKVRLLPSLQVPRDTWNHWRKQYNAEAMLSALSGAAKFIDRSVPVMFITDVDIYYSSLNFIFGLEDPTLAACIVSLARLRPEFYDNVPNAGLLTGRAVKEAVHETGHLLGLEHCPRQACVMAFSPGVTDVDNKKSEFCESCQIKARMRGIALG